MAGLWSPSLSFFARTLHGLLPRWTSLCSGGLGGTICDDLKDDVIWISAGLGCSGLNLYVNGNEGPRKR